MEKDPRDVILRPVITEHSSAAMEHNVNPIEVAKVNTLNVKSKPKRVRYQEGRTRTWKKAMVTLAEGETIEIFAS